jgi:hypothetical protein
MSSYRTSEKRERLSAERSSDDRTLQMLVRESAGSQEAWHYSLLALTALGIAAFIMAIVLFAYNAYNSTTHPLPSYSPYAFVFQGVCNQVTVTGALYLSGNLGCLYLSRFTCNGTLNSTIVIGASQVVPLAAPLPTSMRPITSITSSFQASPTTDGRPQTIVPFITVPLVPIDQRLAMAYVTNEVSPPVLTLGVGLDESSTPIAVASVYGPQDAVTFCYPVSSSAWAVRTSLLLMLFIACWAGHIISSPL